MDNLHLIPKTCKDLQMDELLCLLRFIELQIHDEGGVVVIPVAVNVIDPCISFIGILIQNLIPTVQIQIKCVSISVLQDQPDNNKTNIFLPSYY